MESRSENKYLLLIDLETFKKEFLPFFQEWRDTYIDDLPDHRLEPGEPNYHKYKCRTNWFHMFEKTLLLAIPHMPDPLQSEVIDYVENVFTQLDWSKFRTKEEIATATIILNKVTAWLEQQ